MTISLGNVAFAQNDDQILNANNEEIKNFVSSYFGVVDRSLSELSIDPELSNYYDTKDCLEYIAIDTTIQHRQLQISDLRYSDYQTTLSFEDISYDGKLFNIVVDKNTDMYFNCFKGEPSTIYERHMIAIAKSGKDTFKIVTDDYGDEIKD
jgi:hypothetical protein